MAEILKVFALATLPAAGVFIGALIAERFRISARTLSLMLHGVAGIILAVVAVQIMPEAVQRHESSWIVGLAFGLGGFAYNSVQQVVERVQRKRLNAAGGAGVWMVYVAVFTDLLGDGLMVGSGSSVSLGLAFILSIGAVLNNVPAGFTIDADFKDKGFPRKRRLLLAGSLALPAIGAAPVSYMLLNGRGDALKVAALVFTAGMLALAVIEDMISEAHKSAADTRWSAIAFVCGFVLFILVSALLSPAR